VPTSKRPWSVFAVALLLGLSVIAGCGSDDDSESAADDAQTVTFQKPTETGDDPFTKPADVRGSTKMEVGSGPYGGTGSDFVCDRELLISSLRARPDRLAEWARVLGISPEIGPVARYIRKLRPVTLTQDTRVTNHSFVGGRAVGYQAILQAGTAVLVDENGEPVARCRCGNPLLEPIFIKTAKCHGCPPNYKPPTDCEYGSDACYDPYPNPPKVKGGRKKRSPPGTTTTYTDPRAAFSPSVGTPQDTYTLSASGFRRNVTLSVRLTRPDGGSESYSITTNGSGSGSYTFPRVEDAIAGTYTAVVTDPGSSDRATASATVRATGAQQAPAPDENTPQEQAPDPNYDCPDQPPASPGEDYLRNCPNEPLNP
jgi:hypothetical protein